MQHTIRLVSCNTTLTLVPSLGLRIGPACEAGLSVGMRRERVPPQRIKMKISYNLPMIHLSECRRISAFMFHDKVMLY